MASADLRKELECSVCLNVYTDPVTLNCGHNFCRACIDRVLDTQEGCGRYSCPICRKSSRSRPALQRNIVLHNITENLLTTPPDQEETTIRCTYCIKSPVPAVKSCLLCEASLCKDHLRVHSKFPEHVLLDPTTSLENRKCSVHKEILKYYCTQDAKCICASCCLIGQHKGHQIDSIDAASRKKRRLRDALQKLMTERQETEKRAQSLQERRREVQEEAAGETARVTAMFRDLRRRLEDLEKRVLSDISRQAECRALSDWIQQLEIKKAELSRKMGDMEELCHMTDPLTVLQQSDTGDLCDTEEGGNEDRQRHDEQLHDGGGLDVAGISHTLRLGLFDIIRGVTGWVCIAPPADILLDVNTANNNLHISDDRKTVSRSHIKQNRPETPERFQYYSQVLSSRSFSSGRHYWEVDVGGADSWTVGMCYPSIDRRGGHLLLAAMASADLRKELECSVCLNVYTDPVTLNCGHNFCRACIDRVLDTQEGCGRYSCPICRKSSRSRPALQRNIVLHNITENLLTTPPDQEETTICCTHCLHASVPAVKSCLLCEASLCEDHLRVHSKSPEHVLLDPTTSLENRKCSVHKEILKYYCTQDAKCICASCCLIGQHKGHQIDSIDAASRKKKERLRDALQKLMTERQETEKRAQSLQERRREVQEEAAGETARVTAMFRDLRRRLEDLEKRVLSDISRQAECRALSDWIQQLEIKKAELSRKMGDMEELCHMTDPLTVLQQSDTGDLCGKLGNVDRQRHDEQLHDGGGLDVAGISHTLHTGLSDIIRGVTGGVYIAPADILLDVNTAHNNLHISDDRKTVSRSHIKQNRPETPKRFQLYPQVLSSRSFSSGRHYWEVDVGRSGSWRVGMCYPSMDRRGGQPGIGNNNKSWGLDRDHNQYTVRHDSEWTDVGGRISSNRVRVELDYEAGLISFYDLCDPIRHLHTFTTTFTEPLHAALYVGTGCIKISDLSRVQSMLSDLCEPVGGVTHLDNLECQCPLCIDVGQEAITVGHHHLKCELKAEKSQAKQVVNSNPSNTLALHECICAALFRDSCAQYVGQEAITVGHHHLKCELKAEKSQAKQVVNSNPSNTLALHECICAALFRDSCAQSSSDAPQLIPEVGIHLNFASGLMHASEYTIKYQEACPPKLTNNKYWSYVIMDLIFKDSTNGDLDLVEFLWCFALNASALEFLQNLELGNEVVLLMLLISSDDSCQLISSDESCQLTSSDDSCQLTSSDDSCQLISSDDSCQLISSDDSCQLISSDDSCQLTSSDDSCQLISSDDSCQLISSDESCQLISSDDSCQLISSDESCQLISSDDSCQLTSSDDSCQLISSDDSCQLISSDVSCQLISSDESCQLISSDDSCQLTSSDDSCQLISSDVSCQLISSEDSGQLSLLISSDDSCQLISSDDSCQLTSSDDSCQLISSDDSCQLTSSDDSCQLISSDVSCQLTSSDDSCQLISSDDSCQLTSSDDSCQLISSDDSCQLISSDESCQLISSDDSCQLISSDVSCQLSLPPLMTSASPSPLMIPASSAPLITPASSPPMMTPASQPPLMTPASTSPLMTPASQPPLMTPSSSASSDDSCQLISSDDSCQPISSDDSCQLTSSDDSCQLISSDDSCQLTSSDDSCQLTSSDDSCQLTSSDDSCQLTSSDDSCQLTSSDDSCQLTSSDDSCQLTSSDDSCQLTSSDDSCQLTSSDDSCQLTSSDDSCQLTSSDDSCQLTSSDDSSQPRLMSPVSSPPLMTPASSPPLMTPASLASSDNSCQLISSDDSCQLISSDDSCQLISSDDSCQPISSDDSCQLTSSDDSCQLISSDDSCQLTSSDDSCQLTSSDDSCQLTSSDDSCQLTSSDDSCQLTSSDDSCQLTSSDDSCQLTSSDDSCQLTSSDDSCQLTSSDDSCQLTSSDDSCQLTSSDDSCQLTSSDDSCQLTSSDDSCQLTSSDDSCQLTSSDDSCQLTSSDDFCQLSSSDDSCQLSSSDNSCQLSSSDDTCQLTSSDDSCQLSSSDDTCQLTSSDDSCQLISSHDSCQPISSDDSCQPISSDDSCQPISSDDSYAFVVRNMTQHRAEPLPWIMFRSFPCGRAHTGFFLFPLTLLLSAMASADIRKELECSVCLNIYINPVTLKCGHNFCRVCIARVLDTQEGSGCYFCPDCREKFQERPTLQRNRTLRNIAENLLTTHPYQVTTILCTYCIHSPVPAVKSCLHCDASLCEDHLRVHSKSPDHVLLEPTTFLENRKCFFHKKTLVYYCTEDATYFCVSCSLAGEHKGHQVETLDEAFKKKERLRDALQKLMTEREETEKRVQSLQERWRKVQQEAAGETARVTAMFRDLRRQLEDLEKRVLCEISRQAQCKSLSDWIQQLEIRKEKLSRKMSDMQKLSHMTDSLTVLQQSDIDELCDTEEIGNKDRQRHDEQLHGGAGLDVAGISHTLHTSISNILSWVTGGDCIVPPADILLDVNTAGNNLHISDDRKTVSRSNINQNHPETPERFQDYSQVLSSWCFFSGRHYWEVDVGGSDDWRVGLCYPSMDRRGLGQSVIGDNNKSWVLYRDNNLYKIKHDRKWMDVVGGISSNRVRVELDYEAGRISFYDLCDPIRHLHTFITTFIEPLHAALWVGRGCIKISDVSRV
ncbi:LOW QUALITY PROTEIN: uncharacterized protein PAF06_007284 [Gastrophryne carolinensis]